MAFVSRRTVQFSLSPALTASQEWAVKVLPAIIHELTDVVLMSEEHTVASDVFTFGSMRREQPARTEQMAASDTEQLIGGDER
jgi:hypothetical protein